MRVVLVGLPDERRRLRQQLTPGSVDVVAEYPTMAAARAAATTADAWLLASDDDRSASTEHPEPIEEALTRRELEVVELLADGLSNKGIAERLGISDQTVKFHVAAVCSKLQALNRTDAVRRAIRRGLVAL